MFRLKELREYEDYSMSEIAKKLNIAKSTYSDWESGRSVIPLKHMVNLSNIYCVTLDYLFGLSNKTDKILKLKKINPEKIAKNLKEFRIQKNLTQEELAKSLFISRYTLSRYETNNLLISTSSLYELCKRHSVSADKIIGF